MYLKGGTSHLCNITNISVQLTDLLHVYLKDGISHLCNITSISVQLTDL